MSTRVDLGPTEEMPPDTDKVCNRCAQYGMKNKASLKLHFGNYNICYICHDCMRWLQHMVNDAFVAVMPEEDNRTFSISYTLPPDNVKAEPKMLHISNHVVFDPDDFAEKLSDELINLTRIGKLRGD